MSLDPINYNEENESSDKDSNVLSPKSNYKKCLIISILISSILLLTAIFLILYFLSKNSKQNNPSENTQKNYTIIEKLFIHNPEKEVILYNDQYTNFSQLILSITIDEEPINITSRYYFNESKNYTVKITFNGSLTSMESFFKAMIELIEINFTYIDTSNVTTMKNMFTDCTSIKYLNLNNFNTSQVTDMSYMFNDCKSLTSIDLSNFNTSNVIYMQYMFGEASQLKFADLSNFDTKNVKKMNFMFYSTKFENLNLTNFDTTNLSDMESMFFSCSVTSVDLSSFNVENVVSMSYLFHGCTRLEFINIYSFDTRNLRNYQFMFYSIAENGTIVYNPKITSSSIVDMFPETWTRKTSLD